MSLTKLGIQPEDLFNNKFREDLFAYSQEEVDNLRRGLPISKQKYLQESITRSIKYKPSIDKVQSLIDYIKTLTQGDLKDFEQYVRKHTEQNPNMLWNIIHTKDKNLYKTSDSFYDWVSTLSDDMVDHYACKALDGNPLHSDFVYDTKKTKVEILDGYIAISSSNLSELNKFKERMLASNDCKCEHRIKKHGSVTIHSYIFNMGKHNSI